MFGLGTSEIIIVLVLALLVFGPQKLPEIGRQIGGLMREFRRMSDDVRRTFDVEELTGLSRYDDPLSTASYHPATSYDPDLALSQNDAAYSRLDQQMAGGNGIDEIKTVSRTNGHGGAAVYDTPYDTPRPWSLSDDEYHDAFDATSAPATARFTPLVSAEPPGPARASNDGDSALLPPQKEQ